MCLGASKPQSLGAQTKSKGGDSAWRWPVPSRLESCSCGLYPISISRNLSVPHTFGLRSWAGEEICTSYYLSPLHSMSFPSEHMGMGGSCHVGDILAWISIPFILSGLHVWLSPQ